jgi:hypothetical protein
MQAKILTGITKDDELYFVEIEQQTKEHDYFAMSGFTVKPIELGEAREQAHNSIAQLIGDEISRSELPEWYFKDVDELVDYITATDGSLSGIDTSLLTDKIEVDDVDYVFESGGCGQHQAQDLKHYFIDKTEFAVLMSIWNKYHLKSNVKFNAIERTVIDKMFELGYYKSDKSQDLDSLLVEAIRIINK